MQNAGYLAAQMLSLADAALAARLVEERAAAADAVLLKNAALQESLKSAPS